MPHWEYTTIHFNELPKGTDELAPLWGGICVHGGCNAARAHGPISI
jgi:hypothetical protein